MCGHMCEYELVFVKLLQAQKGVVKYKRSREVIEQFVLMHARLPHFFDQMPQLLFSSLCVLVQLLFECGCYLREATV